MNLSGMAGARLLLVTDEMEIGGTQRQIVHLARGLAQERCQVSVAYFRNRSFFVDELESAGVPVHWVPKRGRIDPAFIGRLVALVRRGRFEILHCFSFTGELWGAVAHVLAPTGTALVTSVRNVYDWYSALQWSLKGWAARRSRAIVANSRSGAAHAESRMRLPAGTIRVVYNGVELRDTGPEARAEMRRGLGLPEERPVALFVGRLVEQKNPALLLRALARLDVARGLVLLLAGEGPLERDLATLARDLAIGERVRFLGPRADVPQLLAAADFVVLPSVREGLSNVILEAMAAGRAVVASNVGGNPELVAEGVSGRLFPSGDEGALAEALASLAADPARRQALGENGRRRAEAEFSVPAMVRGMKAVYTECLPEGRP